MILDYYRLREQPFGFTPNPRFLYHSQGHREALAALLYAVESNVGFASIIAEPGMGKTTLLFALLEQFQRSLRTALLFNTQCNSRELLRYLLEELGADNISDDVVLLHRQFRNLVIQEAGAGRRVLLIIDEAQNLQRDALETVRLLSDYETSSRKLVTIILAGQPALADKLMDSGMQQLQQRISVATRLPRFGLKEISAYINYRLAVAGYVGPALFTESAIRMVAALSRGVPREINRACFLALRIACVRDRNPIDVDVMREAVSELNIGLTVPLPTAADAPAAAADATADPVLTETQTPADQSSSRATPETNASVATAAPPPLQLLESRPMAAVAAAEGLATGTHGPVPPRVIPVPSMQPSSFHEGPVAAIAGQARASAVPVPTEAPTRRDSKPAQLRITRPPAKEVARRTTSETPFLLLTPSQRPALNLSPAEVPTGARRTAFAIAVCLLIAVVIATTVFLRARSMEFSIPMPPLPATVPPPAATALSPAPASTQGLPAEPLPAESAPTNRLAVLQPTATPQSETPVPPLSPAAKPTTKNERQPGNAEIRESPPKLNPFQGAAAVRSATSVGVEPGLLLREIKPAYPQAAIRAGVQGPVVLRVRVTPEGAVKVKSIVSGHHLLVPAALEAAQSWRYSPYRENGQPVEVETLITVNFSPAMPPRAARHY